MEITASDLLGRARSSEDGAVRFVSQFDLAIEGSTMPITFKTIARLAPIALSALTFAAFTGCEKGPAEKMGTSIDRGVDKVRDTVSPAGPGEKAGRAVDRIGK